MARRKVGDGQADLAGTVAATDSARSAPDWPSVLQCPACGARQMTKQAREIDPWAKACMKCGKALSAFDGAKELPVGETAELAQPADPTKALSDALASGAFFGKGADVVIPPPPNAPKVDDSIRSAMSEKQKADAEDLKARLTKKGSMIVEVDPDVDQEVEATHPEEMYGMKGSFSSYRVGPFTSKTRIRPGETRVGAYRRLLEELAAVADEERPKAKAAFLKHFETAFVNG